MELRTPLYECHIKLGGKMVPFAGYSLPVQYSGLIAEHNAVRNAAGLFDVSHMTEIFIEGKDALKCVNYIFSNDFTKMESGKVRYSVMMNDNGGIVDDMVLYKAGDEKFIVVGNGANRQKDFDWIKQNQTGDVTISDLTDYYAQMAIQGPNSKSVLLKLVSEEDIPEKYYSYKQGKIMGKNALISQTGYTGEHGYEIYVNPDDAVEIWEGLLEAGEDLGLIPCGLGARDTLRLEAGMPLYGHEMSDEINPVEAGLKFAVKMQKDDFVGKAALSEIGDSGRTRVGIKITGKGIAREDSDILVNGEVVGKTTSGTHAPYLGYPIAMGYVKNEHSQVGTAIVINVRGRMIEAEIVEMPFYSKK
ncbi:glycine cleavage system aminomethyltransferase GcvT [Tyzzerella sp. OttesenSCG-928-J15]|nr:glycine cleavage system aminomethyltransferase GcvT [Tyzzerella sp. OttesenSCG-928-J15]